MLPTVWALLPAVCVQVWWYGVPVLATVFTVIVLCYALECVVALVRKQALGGAVSDGSTLVTALLLGLAVTPNCSPWQLGLGAVFAIVVAKHCYGGLGRNVFNPAMVGYAAVLISFPGTMAVWPDPLMVDGMSSATPLADARIVARGGPSSPLTDAWIWINAAYALGGAWLLWRRMIPLALPLAVIAGVVIGSVGFATASLETTMAHLFAGATFACAFFIATDPVSAVREPWSRWPYGLLIGLIIVVIREHGSYPDGVAFAVLLANALAPLMDRLVTKVRYE